MIWSWSSLALLKMCTLRYVSASVLISDVLNRCRVVRTQLISEEEVEIEITTDSGKGKQNKIILGLNLIFHCFFNLFLRREMALSITFFRKT